MDDIAIIDTHHHFWDLGRNHYPWLAGHEEKHFFLGDYEALKRDYMPDDYRRDCAGHNVIGTVHVEAEWDRDNQVGETHWLTEVSEQHGLPTVIVAHAWFDRDNTEDVLARQAASPLVRGIRSKPVTAPTATTSVDGQPGTLGDPNWRAGFALLEKYGLSWDLRVPPWHLEEAAALVAGHPGIPVILNHTGFPWDRGEEGLAAWRRGMTALAAVPHVSVKLSEFGLAEPGWNYEGNRRVVLETIEMFGPARCMFASNFPVAGLRASYDHIYSAYKDFVRDFSRAEQELLFAGTAKRAYRIEI